MNCIDNLICGQIVENQINIKNRHFNEMAQVNRIPVSFVIDSMLYVDPINPNACKDYRNRFEAFYPAPESKSYELIKVIFSFSNNTYNLITVMPDSNSQSKRRRWAEKPDNLKNKDIKTAKAFNN